MRLKTIKATGLKGRTFNYEVGPAVVFTGPSFSGKTAVLDAVKVGLLGYHPELGKRASDTLKLSGSGRLEVELAFDDTELIRREYFLAGQSAKSVNADEPFMHPALLDITEYFAMSGPERLRYVLASIPLPEFPDGADPDAAVVKALMAITCKDVDPEAQEAALKEACVLARELGEAREAEGATVGEWLEGLIDSMNAKKKEADAACKQFAGLAQGSTQLKAGAPTAPARNVEPELRAAQERLQKIRSELHALRESVTTNAKHNDRIEWLKRQLAATPNNAEAIAGIESFLLDIAEVLKGPCPDAMVPYKRMMELQEEIGIKTAEKNRLGQELQKLVNEHDRNMKLDACPFCKSKKKGWQEAIVAEHEAKVRENGALCAAIDEALNKLVKAKDEASREYQTVNARATAHRDAQRQQGEQQNRLHKLRTVDKQFEQYKIELAALESSRPPAVDGFRVPELETEERLAVSEVERLDGENRRFIASRATEAQVLKANAAHAREKARVEVFKQGAGAIRLLQQVIMDRLFTGMMDTMNRFTRGILKAPLEYVDGDIGYKDERGRFVSHECFSGTEEALAYAALSVALAAKAPFRLVVIDELGIADFNTKSMMLARMVELVNDGIIDQFFGADAGTVPSVEGMQVVTVN